MKPSKEFLFSKNAKLVLSLNGIAAVIYFFTILFYFPHGNEILFWLLIAGEVFHTWQVLTYIYTVWDMEYIPRIHRSYTDFSVDVYITVAGEPIEIIRETATAAKAVEYPHKTIYLLNDGFVAKKDNWEEVILLAKELKIGCITRKKAGGAKAGNINHALALTTGSLIAIFDADHVPYKDFLKKTIPHFNNKKVAFVQTPQYYKNYQHNMVTHGAWEQQELFFGPICRGKNRLNSATMCGTNMLFRRTALDEVGGMCQESIAEDFITGMFLHEKGWHSVYVPEVLAEGLAPEDFLSYYKQQFRWARGALDIIFTYNLLMRRGLSFAQKIQYLASVSFFLSGSVVLMNALLPLAFLFFSMVPIEVSSMSLAAVFIPYIVFTVLTLQASSNHRFSFRALSFSMSSFPIQIKALWAALSGQKSSFVVTSKTALSGNFLNLVAPHLTYIVLVCIGGGVAIVREGLSASVINNLAWAAFNVVIFIPFIIAAAPPKIQNWSVVKNMSGSTGLVTTKAVQKSRLVVKKASNEVEYIQH